MSAPRIAYFYDPSVGCYYYGSHHPMKPYRLTMTHSLILQYGIHRSMHVFRPRRATREQLTAFHSPDFIDFLYSLPENGRPSSADSDMRSPTMAAAAAAATTTSTHKRRTLQEPSRPQFTLTDDCPAFYGMSNFIELFSGASIQAAEKLNQGQYDIAINWSGGLHHARRDEASGFCYVNDITLGILELLKVNPRVLYVDIDIHHGDGVQDAFYLSDRVMTVSFHKFGDGFFPGTGDVTETGLGPGKYCSVNVPLKDGIDDDAYHELFKPIIRAAMETYRPTAVALQCGADGLKFDRLGCFSLSHAGHAECVRFVTSYGLPTLVLGGGGYTVRNVARAWTYETALLCGRGDELRRARIPETSDYYQSFGPDFALLPQVRSQVENMNSRQYLENLRATVLQNIRRLNGAPAVSMEHFPATSMLIDSSDFYDYEAGANPDERQFAQQDGSIPPAPVTEFYEDDQDQDHF